MSNGYLGESVRLNAVAVKDADGNFVTNPTGASLAIVRPDGTQALATGNPLVASGTWDDMTSQWDDSIGWDGLQIYAPYVPVVNAGSGNWYYDFWVSGSEQVGTWQARWSFSGAGMSGLLTEVANPFVIRQFQATPFPKTY